MKYIFVSILLLISLNSSAQEYSCKQLEMDLAAWEQTQNSNNIKWANAIKEKGIYKMNPDGAIEYVYILNTKDSVNIATLKKLSFDYITYLFNINNATRANMEINSPNDGLIYIGNINKVGEFNGMDERNIINAKVLFDFRFKANRIRFSVKIQGYNVKKWLGGNLIQNYSVLVHNCFPLNPNSNHKKSYAMAFINSNKNCMMFATGYLIYLNKHLNEKHQTTADDW